MSAIVWAPPAYQSAPLPRETRGVAAPPGAPVATRRPAREEVAGGFLDCESTVKEVWRGLTGFVVNSENTCPVIKGVTAKCKDRG